MSKAENKVGRPRIIESPEEMNRLVDEFVEKCGKEKIPVTLTGCILHLGLSSRESLHLYEERQEFIDSVKRLKMIVENVYEMNLHGTTSTGSIFALKNMGWKDKQEVEQSGDLNINILRFSDEKAND